MPGNERCDFHDRRHTEIFGTPLPEPEPEPESVTGGDIDISTLEKRQEFLLSLLGRVLRGKMKGSDAKGAADIVLVYDRLGKPEEK